MDSARVDDSSGEALRVRYRDHGVAFNVLLITVILGSRFFHGPTTEVSLATAIWLAGTLLLLGSGLVMALRSQRGLTLDAGGITWHQVELSIPWSQVTGLDVDTNVRGSGKPHLIVRVADPAEARRGRRGLAGFVIRGNTQQYGGPIAVKAHLLAVPAETVIAAADRLRQAPAEAGDRRARARVLADLWDTAGLAGFAASLATIVGPVLF
ncbi:hypothetical protein [Actinomadura chokoriensis]|uniref:hypothetical protein n=1 Tax=Actinomadura chokoriensis TaxID=454156 RepID=UPI0031F8A9DC